MTVLKKEVPANSRASSRGKTSGASIIQMIRRKGFVGGFLS